MSRQIPGKVQSIVDTIDETNLLVDTSGVPVGTATNPLYVNSGSGVTEDVNLAEVNGVAVNVGTGAASTGTQRVAVASDSSITANAGTNLNTSALNLEATQSAMSAKLPASLGAKTGALSLSVVPSTDTNFVVAGSVASAATDSGNPVKVGGRYNATLPTLADGQRGDVQITSKGVLLSSIINAAGTVGVDVQAAAADSGINTINGLSVYSAIRVFNNSTWDRAYSITGLQTSGIGVQAVGAVGRYNAAQPTLTDGQYGGLQLNTKGALRIVIQDDSANSVSTIAPSSDGGNLGGNRGLQVTNAGYRFNGSTWDRDTKANSTSRIVSAAASTNATSAKASAGNLHHVAGYNAAASVRYLKLYNKASAPTVGTDTPTHSFALAPLANFSFEFPNGGYYFSTGIAYALTTGSADADTGALTAGDVLGLNLSYN